MTLPLEWRASITGTPQVISELQRLKQEYNNGQIGLQEYTQKSRYLNSQLRTVNNSFNQQRNILYATHPALQTMTRAMSVFGHVSSTVLSVMNALNLANLNTNSIANEIASGQVELAQEQIKLNNLIKEVIKEGGEFAGNPEDDPRVKAQQQLIDEIKKRGEQLNKDMKAQAFQNQLTQITAWVNIVAGVGTQIATIWALFRVLKLKMGLGITVPIRYVAGPVPISPVVSPTAGIGGAAAGAGTIAAAGPVSSAGPPGGKLSAGGIGLGAFLAIFGPSIADTILAAFGDAKAQFREEQRRLEGVAFQEKLSGKEPTVGINESGVYVEVVKTSTQATQTLTDTIKEMMIKFPDKFASSFYDKYRDVTTSNMTAMDDLGTVYIKNGQILDNNTKNISDLGKSILKQYEQYKTDNPEIIRTSDQLILTNEQLIESQTQIAQNIDDLIKKGISINVTGGGAGSSPGAYAGNPYAGNYPGYEPGLPEYDIGAASGYEGIVSKPTVFLAGESGSEMVSIKPLSSTMNSSKSTVIIQNITVQGSILAEREVERIADRALKRDLKRVGF